MRSSKDIVSVKVDVTENFAVEGQELMDRSGDEYLEIEADAEVNLWPASYGGYYDPPEPACFEVNCIRLPNGKIWEMSEDLFEDILLQLEQRFDNGDFGL